MESEKQNVILNVEIDLYQRTYVWNYIISHFGVMIQMPIVNREAAFQGLHKTLPE